MGSEPLGAFFGILFKYVCTHWKWSQEKFADSMQSSYSHGILFLVHQRFWQNFGKKVIREVFYVTIFDFKLDILDFIIYSCCWNAGKFYGFAMAHWHLGTGQCGMFHVPYLILVNDHENIICYMWYVVVYNILIFLQ